MKKEITIGQALSILLVLVVALIGWGVNIEVRLATIETQYENMIEMRGTVSKTHEAVIRIEEWIKNHDKPKSD
jgi:hypothetical protein